MFISSIDFKVSLEGRGVVNRDAENVAKQYAFGAGASLHNNQIFAKTSVQARKIIDGENEKIKYTRKVKLSKNILRNAVFENEQPFQTSHLLANLKTKKGTSYLPKIMASYSHLVRGFLYAQDNSNAYKRKSPLLLSDAIQTNDEIVKPEVGCSSGLRTDTSFYYFDQVGNIAYEAIGSLDLAELGFVSCDPIFDRQAFNSDDYNEVVDLLKSRLGLNPTPTVKHYMKSGSEVLLAERGMMLTEEDCLKLAIMTIQRIQKLFIRRTSGWAKTKQITVALTESHGIPLNFNDGKYILTIDESTDVDKMLREFFKENNLKIKVGYELANEEIVLMRQKYEAEIAEKKEAKRIEKDEIKASKTSKISKTKNKKSH